MEFGSRKHGLNPFSLKQQLQLYKKIELPSPFWRSDVLGIRRRIREDKVKGIIKKTHTISKTPSINSTPSPPITLSSSHSNDA